VKLVQGISADVASGTGEKDFGHCAEQVCGKICLEALIVFQLSRYFPQSSALLRPALLAMTHYRSCRIHPRQWGYFTYSRSPGVLYITGPVGLLPASRLSPKLIFLPEFSQRIAVVYNCPWTSWYRCAWLAYKYAK
jgi:hypothetical protein